MEFRTQWEQDELDKRQRDAAEAFRLRDQPNPFVNGVKVLPFETPRPKNFVPLSTILGLDRRIAVPHTRKLPTPAAYFGGEPAPRSPTRSPSPPQSPRSPSPAQSGRKRSFEEVSQSIPGAYIADESDEIVWTESALREIKYLRPELRDKFPASEIRYPPGTKLLKREKVIWDDGFEGVWSGEWKEWWNGEPRRLWISEEDPRYLVLFPPKHSRSDHSFYIGDDYFPDPRPPRAPTYLEAAAEKLGAALDLALDDLSYLKHRIIRPNTPFRVDPAPTTFREVVEYRAEEAQGGLVVLHRRIVNNSHHVYTYVERRGQEVGGAIHRDWLRLLRASQRQGQQAMTGVQNGYHAVGRVANEAPMLVATTYRHAETTVNAAKRRCVETVDRVVPRSIRDFRVPLLWAGQQHPVPELVADFPASPPTPTTEDLDIADAITADSFRDVIPKEEMMWLADPEGWEALCRARAEAQVEISDSEDEEEEEDGTEDGATVDEEMSEEGGDIDPEGEAAVQADTEDVVMGGAVEAGEESINPEGETSGQADTEDAEEGVDPEGESNGQADTEDVAMEGEAEAGEEIIDPESDASGQANTEDDESVDEEADEDLDEEADNEVDEEADDEVNEETEGAVDEAVDQEMSEDEGDVDPEGNPIEQAHTGDNDSSSESDTSLEDDEDDLENTIYLSEDDEETAQNLNRLALEDESEEKADDTNEVADPKSEKKADDAETGASQGSPSRVSSILAATASPETGRLASSNRRLSTRAQRQREAEEKARKEEEERLAAEAAEEERRRRLYRENPEESIFPPISAEMKAKVDKILSSGPRVHIAQYQHNGITRQTFNTLVGHNAWLNDEMVNKSTEQSVDHVLDLANLKRGTTPPIHAYNSFFYKTLCEKGPKGVSRWGIRAKIAGEALLDVETVFLPINEGHSHWTLIVISPSLRTVEYFDSFHTKGDKHWDAIKGWLAAELGDKYDANEWTCREGVGPTQKNGWDCGVFVISTVKSIAFGWDPKFAYSSEDMAAQRWRIAAEILTNNLKGELEPNIAEGRMERLKPH